MSRIEREYLSHTDLLRDYEEGKIEGCIKGQDPADVQSNPVRVVGYVVSLRKLSKKLFFVNIIDEESVERCLGSNVDATTAEVRFLEVIVSVPRVGATADDVTACRKLCVMTNQLAVEGYPQRTEKGALVFAATRVELLTSHACTDPTMVGNARTGVKLSAANAVDSATSRRVRVLQNISTGRSMSKIPLGVEKGGWLPPLCKKWILAAREDVDNAPDMCDVQGCAYRHYGTPGELQRFREGVVLRGQEHAMTVEDPVHNEEDKQAASARSSVFANFLTETFGADYLRTGTGVSDIAGGVGAVTFELHVKRDIHTTLIDPRPPKLIKYHQRYLKEKTKQRLKEERARAAEDDDDEEVPDVFDLPVDEDASSGPTPPLRPTDPQITFPYKEVFFSKESATSVPELRNASLFVGMHPDQATCPIVDAALALEKPFCIVPCCVFPSLFPDRRTSDGEPVATYPQYVRYLKERDPRIRTAYLPFKGRNLALYLHPDDIKGASK